MSLTIEGRADIPTDIVTAWAMLRDIEVLRACIPGCEKLDQLSPTQFSGVVALRIGPIKARFKGQVRIENELPPHACTIAGEGEGGIAGFAKGGADVRLSPGPAGCTLEWRLDAEAGGKIAQLGQRLMAGTIRKLAESFFKAFSERCAPLDQGSQTGSV